MSSANDGDGLTLQTFFERYDSIAKKYVPQQHSLAPQSPMACEMPVAPLPDAPFAGSVVDPSSSLNRLEEVLQASVSGVPLSTAALLHGRGSAVAATGQRQSSKRKSAAHSHTSSVQSDPTSQNKPDSPQFHSEANADNPMYYWSLENATHHHHSDRGTCHFGHHHQHPLSNASVTPSNSSQGNTGSATGTASAAVTITHNNDGDAAVEAEHVVMAPFTDEKADGIPSLARAAITNEPSESPTTLTPSRNPKAKGGNSSSSGAEGGAEGPPDIDDVAEVSTRTHRSSRSGGSRKSGGSTGKPASNSLEYPSTNPSLLLSSEGSTSTKHHDREKEEVTKSLMEEMKHVVKDFRELLAMVEKLKTAAVLPPTPEKGAGATSTATAFSPLSQADAPQPPPVAPLTPKQKFSPHRPTAISSVVKPRRKRSSSSSSAENVARRIHQRQQQLGLESFRRGKYTNSVAPERPSTHLPTNVSMHRLGVIQGPHAAESQPTSTPSQLSCVMPALLSVPLRTAIPPPYRAAAVLTPEFQQGSSGDDRRLAGVFSLQSGEGETTTAYNTDHDESDSSDALRCRRGMILETVLPQSPCEISRATEGGSFVTLRRATSLPELSSWTPTSTVHNDVPVVLSDATPPLKEIVPPATFAPSSDGALPTHVLRPSTDDSQLRGSIRMPSSSDSSRADVACSGGSPQFQLTSMLNKKYLLLGSLVSGPCSVQCKDHDAAVRAAMHVPTIPLTEEKASDCILSVEMELAFGVEQGCPVVIRTFSFRAASTPIDMAQQLQPLKSLRHDKVAQVYDTFVDTLTNRLFLVTEYADRGSIAHVTKEGVCHLALPIVQHKAEWLIGVAVPVFKALLYLHLTCGVAHCNICPENILMTNDGRILLAGAGMPTELNQHHRLKSDVPVVPLDKQQADDLFCLGWTLHCLWHGSSPSVEAVEACAQRNLQVELPNPCSHGSEKSPEVALEIVIVKLLSCTANDGKPHHSLPNGESLLKVCCDLLQDAGHCHSQGNC